MSAIDIDRNAAHDAAQRELSKPIYPKASLGERISDWLNELFYRIFSEGSSVPGGWFTLTVLGILLVVAVVVAVRVARRTMRGNRGADYALFDSRQLSSAEHRATAEQYAAAADWPHAIRHRLRAVARQLEETGVLDQVPGRTATELGRDAAGAIPELAAEFGWAADMFNDVTYGQRPGTATAYRRLAELDDRLRAHRVTEPTTAATASVASDGWAPLP